MDLLKFITAGSVDDGKSTLIGRLLYDSDSLPYDLIESLKEQTKTNTGNDFDLALLTDGLKAEREQGITIDVAYKYFSTDKRKFIIIDSPGHIEYTRNMVTGASSADLAIVLIDARHGVIEQTKRHTLICTLLKIEHIIFAINKMDMVGYNEDSFTSISAQIEDMLKKIGGKVIISHTIIPISALKGDNIISSSSDMGWYKGSNLLSYLESYTPSKVQSEVARMYVQGVNRPQTPSLPDFRGYAGLINSGYFSIGDEVTVYPSEQKAVITEFYLGDKRLQEASKNQSILMLLDKDIDISRGSLICKSIDKKPNLTNILNAIICNMTSLELRIGGKYLLQVGTFVVPAMITAIEYVIDVHTLENISKPTLSINDLAKVTIQTAQPCCFDNYETDKHTGCGILIDPTSGNTLASVILNN